MDADDKIAGSIYLSAFGDAWGYRTEFIFEQDILTKRYQTASTPPTTAIITDDTQMNIAVLKAIQHHSVFFASYNPEDPEHQRIARLHFIKDFLIWKDDPRNNRAPGLTCLGALDTFEKYRARYPNEKYSGLEGSVKGSKGCGANMRVPWLGLHLGLTDAQVSSLAYEQAVVTHGHDHGTISASFTALVTRNILTGKIQPGGITDWLIDKSNTEPLLGSHPAWKSFVDDYLVRELEKSKANQRWILDPSFDLCNIFGGGWVADEAFVLAVIICDAFMNHRNSVETRLDGIRRAAHLTGDSDSVACITGSFMGAHLGKKNIPVEWDSWLEEDYRQDLIEITQFLKERR